LILYRTTIARRGIARLFRFAPQRPQPHTTFAHTRATKDRGPCVCRVFQQFSNDLSIPRFPFRTGNALFLKAKTNLSQGQAYIAPKYASAVKIPYARLAPGHAGCTGRPCQREVPNDNGHAPPPTPDDCAPPLHLRVPIHGKMMAKTVAVRNDVSQSTVVAPSTMRFQSKVTMAETTRVTENTVIT
jgi:hypothetical protein